MPKRVLTGEVVNDVENKTIKVRVSRSSFHPKYGKKITTHQKYTAHDPQNECKIGDKVSIIESAPISKLKRWVLLEKESV